LQTTHQNKEKEKERDMAQWQRTEKLLVFFHCSVISALERDGWHSVYSFGWLYCAFVDRINRKSDSSHVVINYRFSATIVKKLLLTAGKTYTYIHS
jgi:hypothetical protein